MRSDPYNVSMTSFRMSVTVLAVMHAVFAASRPWWVHSRTVETSGNGC